MAFYYIQPAPPQSITMTTGANEGAYQEFGQRYRDILARHGIKVNLRPSAGAVENLERPCGRGLLLIHTFMDEVHFNATGNEITVVKNRK